MFCKYCGNKLMDDWVVCPKCGREINNKEQVNYQNEFIPKIDVQKMRMGKAETPLHKKAWFWVLIVLLGFLWFLGFIIAVAGLLSSSGNETVITEETELVMEDMEEQPAIEEYQSAVGNTGNEIAEKEPANVTTIPEKKPEPKKYEIINVDYEFIYGGILDSIPSGYSYTYYDIDKDGYLECFAQQGTCNADMVFEIYTTDGKATRKLGEIVGADTSLYKCEGKNGCYSYYARGEYQLIEYVYIENGSIKTKTVKESHSIDGIDAPELKHPMSMNVIPGASVSEVFYYFEGQPGMYYDFSNGSEDIIYSVEIYNITDTTFDFCIKKYDTLIFKRHTAQITGDSTGTYYGKQYTLTFWWSDPGTVSISGFDTVEGLDFINNEYYGVS